MAESFLQLSARDRADALGVAATSSGRPADLLEKDVWVVWTLDALFTAPFGEQLRFKGGTSLSKAYRVIARFSEDLDITYDMRALLPECATADAELLPPTRSQEKKWTDGVQQRLPEWIGDTALPNLRARLAREGSPARATLGGKDRLYLEYEPVAPAATGYVRSQVIIEFGARSTGEPTRPCTVTCDAAEYLPMLAFPTANPLVMKAERTFWEKATAVHVFCMNGKLTSERFARHWYDLVRLDDAGIAHAALGDREVASRVARHKSWFFPAKDAAGSPIDYMAAVNGSLRLVPDGAARVALSADYGRMVDAGLLEERPPTFDALLNRCAELERRGKAAATIPSHPPLDLRLP